MADLARRVARWRVPLGYVLAVVAWWYAKPTFETLAAGALVGAAGEALRVWAAGHLEKGREVTSTGPYAFMRHPLYVGSTILGAGLAIASNRMLVGVLVLVYLAVTVTAAIRSEEAHLTEKFGGAYPAYRSGTAAAAERRFSFARAMRNREYRALAGFAAALVLMALRRLV